MVKYKTQYSFKLNSGSFKKNNIFAFYDKSYKFSKHKILKKKTHEIQAFAIKDFKNNSSFPIIKRF